MDSLLDAQHPVKVGQFAHDTIRTRLRRKARPIPQQLRVDPVASHAAARHTARAGINDAQGTANIHRGGIAPRGVIGGVCCRAAGVDEALLRLGRRGALHVKGIFHERPDPLGLACLSCGQELGNFIPRRATGPRQAIGRALPRKPKGVHQPELRLPLTGCSRNQCINVRRGLPAAHQGVGNGAVGLGLAGLAEHLRQAFKNPPLGKRGRADHGRGGNPRAKADQATFDGFPDNPAPVRIASALQAAFSHAEEATTAHCS